MNITNWSYSGDPSQSPLDEVRFLVGDTDRDDKLVSDDEINYCLGMISGNQPPPSNGNYSAAALVADNIASRFSRQVDKQVGDLSISYSQRAGQFKTLAFKLRQRATLREVVTYSGGNSRATKIQTISNPDFIGTAVRIDGMDYADPGPGEMTPGENNIP